MNILLVGGFLGSGKTTIISHLTELLLQHDQTVCIIENEIGANGIDNILLSSSQVTTKTLANGCVCCQITGSLISAIQELSETIEPDWLIVELSGIALLDTLRQYIYPFFSSAHTIICLSVIDAARWKKLYQAAEIIITNQVRGGDILIINKLDIQPDISAISADVEKICSSFRLCPMTAATTSCQHLLDMIYEEINAYDCSH